MGGIDDVTEIGRPTAKKDATWTSGIQSMTKGNGNKER